MQKTAFEKCIQALLEGRSEGKRFPGVVILSDCQALLEISGGQLCAIFSGSMLAVEELKTTGKTILPQCILSHVDVGIRGNEIADDLANRGRRELQPNQPASFAECKAAIRCGMAELWEAALRRDDDNIQSNVRKLALGTHNPKDPWSCFPDARRSKCSACARSTPC